MSGDHVVRHSLVHFVVRVDWLTRYGPEGASSRYRVWQYLELLEQRGFVSGAEPLATWRAGSVRAAGSVARRLATLLRRPAADVIVIQKAPVMPPQLWVLAQPLLRRVDVPLIWDIDDAIWANSDGERRMTLDMCRLADVVVAGNELIEEWVRDAGAGRVEVIPTCYTPAAVPSNSHRTDRTIEIVWIGSPSTAALLHAEEARIREMLSVPDTRLTMVGGEPPALMRDLPIDVVPWSPEAEHEHLARADFGLALQPRTEFADHKCGFKIIQYMAYGVIPIATDNPVHRQITSGLGQLVAADTDAEVLRSFVAAGVDDAARDAVRRRWRASYSTEVAIGAWERLLRELTS